MGAKKFIQMFGNLLRNPLRRKPAVQIGPDVSLVKADREAFGRRAVQMFFTGMDSEESRETFRVLENPSRPRRALKRVV